MNATQKKKKKNRNFDSGKYFPVKHSSTGYYCIKNNQTLELPVEIDVGKCNSSSVFSPTK